MRIRNALVFTEEQKFEKRDVFTAGGRILTVVGKGRSIGEANRNAYDLIGRKRFPGLWYRDDIGNAYFC